MALACGSPSATHVAPTMVAAPQPGAMPPPNETVHNIEVGQAFQGTLHGDGNACVFVIDGSEQGPCDRFTVVAPQSGILTVHVTWDNIPHFLGMTVPRALSFPGFRCRTSPTELRIPVTAGQTTEFYVYFAGATELSARTFWTFQREFSSSKRQWGSDPDPGHGSAHLLVPRAVQVSPGLAVRHTGPWRSVRRRTGHRFPTRRTSKQSVVQSCCILFFGGGLVAVLSPSEGWSSPPQSKTFREFRCSPRQSTTRPASHARGQWFESISAHHANDWNIEGSSHKDDLECR